MSTSRGTKQYIPLGWYQVLLNVGTLRTSHCNSHQSLIVGQRSTPGKRTCWTNHMARTKSIFAIHTLIPEWTPISQIMMPMTTCGRRSEEHELLCHYLMCHHSIPGILSVFTLKNPSKFELFFHFGEYVVCVHLHILMFF